MIKAVFFDLGNTLIDLSAIYSGRVDEEDVKRFAEIGVTVSKERVREIALETERSIENDFKADSRKQAPGFFFLKMCEFMGIDISAEKAAELDNRSKTVLMEEHSLLPGAIETLETLKCMGMSLAVVSNTSKKAGHALMEKFGLYRYFDEVVLSEEVSSEKNTGIPFRVAMNRIGLKPEEILMVGDRIDEDIYGAHKLGIKTVKFEFGYWKDKWYSARAEPDFKIHAIEEVINIVEKLKR